MPRKAKQPNGQQPSLPPTAPTGMPYGAHQATIQSQQAMPLPGTPPLGAMPAAAAPPDVLPSAGGAAPLPPTGGPPPGGPMSMLDAISAAQATAPPEGGLGAPTGRPGEPVLTGASSAPPAPQTSTQKVAQMIADLTGDPVAQALAQRAAELGQ